MGEVYLAEDTDLKRQVALKVLPESVRSDPDRLARFRKRPDFGTYAVTLCAGYTIRKFEDEPTWINSSCTIQRAR